MYCLKAVKVIINGNIVQIIPKPLPENPQLGYLTLDSVDGKLKYYNGTDWIILEALKVQQDDSNEISDVYVLNFEGAVEVTNEGNGKVNILINSGQNFGTYYEYFVSEEESSTNSLSLQTKLAVITQSLPAGTYRISCFAEMKIDNSSHEYAVDFDVDGTIQCTDAGNATGSQSEWASFYGFVNLNFESGSPETHTLRIRWRASQQSATAYIRRARIEIWRVS